MNKILVPIVEISKTTVVEVNTGLGPQGPQGPPGIDGNTPVKGVDYFDGVDGYTPIKDIDYFDGKDGLNGVDGYTPVKGVDYFDGEKGDKGDTGAIPDVSDIVYTPNSLSLNSGTYVSGSVADVKVLYGTVYTIREVNSTPGYLLEFNFTDVIEFNKLRLHLKYYGGGTSHTANIEIYNYNTSTWIKLSEFTITAALQFIELPLNSLDYISGGNAKVRFNHVSSGNTSHYLDVDYIAVLKTLTGSKGVDGVDGVDGVTPIKGTDYFTTAEIQSIHDSVYADLLVNVLGPLDSINGEVV